LEDLLVSLALLVEMELEKCVFSCLEALAKGDETEELAVLI
jgi:hypothetical protein